ncbi:Hpt domain-containing protein [Allochromatium palmeri]|uniref:Hpt domain-containing protein n=2 Tax=Allochromatium palmeri TaxID=231048 RepID=A0A6N8EA28_9GAMM|nr:Hpt domain-containing protein [Allochromatium palmeri]
MIDPVYGMDSSSVHDTDSALYLVGGDAALAAELMQALLDGLPDEIAALRAALAESDWPGLAEYAHQVRGATRYCGVPALDAAIEALERAARLGDGLRCEDCFLRVELQARRLQEAMTARDAE